MLTVAIAAALIVLAVLGAEFVRSACRRQLMSPILPARAAVQPAAVEVE